MNSDSKSNKSSSLSSSSKPKTMEELLKSYKTSFLSYKKGDIATGKITKLTPQEILIDINSKSEAVVLEKDKKILRNILSFVKEGDEVKASVLDPESDRGHPVVSLRRFIDDMLWKELDQARENRTEKEVLITESTKGGFIAITDRGLTGFLPNSHVLYKQQQDFLNKKINVFILELARPDRKIIFSQKPVLRGEDFVKAVQTFKIDQKVDAIVSNITSFGVFVGVQNKDGEQIDGLVHISEISWDKVENVSELFSIGQKIETVIIGFDRDSKRIDLSIKRLTADPFEEIAKEFSVDQKIKGKVERILPAGVLIRVGSRSQIEGFIRREKIPPTVSYEIGEEVNTTVSQIDKKRHRIILVPVLKVKPIGYK